MDDSRIRSKTASFSFENGLVWTGPKESHIYRAMKYSIETTSFGKKNLHIIQGNFPVWTIVQRRDQGAITSGVFYTTLLECRFGYCNN